MIVGKLIARWSQDHNDALRQMIERTTKEDRLTGFGKSLRVEAKFHLLALTPLLFLCVLSQIGWPRGLDWHVLFWLSLSWAAIIGGFFVASVWKAYWGASHRTHNEENHPTTGHERS